jgi:myo-inositol-1(or 4)-monophosphatase
MLYQVEAVIHNSAKILRGLKILNVTTKEGHANFVTDADKRIQEYLGEELTRILPGSTVFGEEKENNALGEEPTWVVDPIDGTLNYMHGLGHSAISVALAEGRSLRLAAIYNPYRDEMFTAQAGHGARLNGEIIRCSETPFERSLVFYGTSPYDQRLVRATFSAAESLMLKTADLRRMGSAALDLAYIACGRADVFFEYSLSPWDYAAGALLVKEAGGEFKLLGMDNSVLDFSKPAAVFASNKPCHGPALEIIQAAYREAH